MVYNFLGGLDLFYILVRVGPQNSEVQSWSWRSDTHPNFRRYHNSQSARVFLGE